VGLVFSVAVLVQTYLSIYRPDLARKEFDRAKNWAEDETLLQLIEASIGMVTGKDGYADARSFFTEQLGNPSLTSPHLLTSRGVTRLLRGEVIEARSDFEEAVSQQNGHEDAETLAAMAVAAGLAPKRPDVDDLWT
jgi:coatomer protein complex subunit epsilon